MKAKTLLTSVIVLVLLFSVGGSASMAQTPLGGSGTSSPSNQNEDSPSVMDANASAVLPVQGYLTNAAGAPLNGNYNITASIYDVSSGGVALCTDTDSITVVNGRFNMAVDYCTSADIYGEAIYLGLKVGADAEMTPRQQLYPVPYAFSLRPGAVINNTGTTGHALELDGAVSAIAGSTLHAQNTNAAGISIVGLNSSTDTTLLVQNNGAGDLIKGFGNNGGNDEFRIENNGTIQSEAPTYVFISGNSLVKNLSGDSTRWDMQGNGAARIWRGGSVGDKVIYYPVTIPAVLYGQPVEIKGMTVYYLCEDGTTNYITETDLWRATDADSDVQVVLDTVDHVSNTASSYTIVPTTNTIMNSGSGILAMYLTIHFVDDVHYVQIGGIRLQLGTHD